jgi:hypothetical protein
VKKLRSDYDTWFADVSATRNYEPPKIFLGTANENPVTLTRQDWRGQQASWDKGGQGHWEVDVREAGGYEVTLRMPKAESARKATFQLRDVTVDKVLPAGADRVVVQGLKLTKGPGQLKGTVEDNGRVTGAHYVDVKRV